MNILVLVRLLPLLTLFLPSVAFATVFEFNSDGSVKVYEAQDYLAQERHQRFSHHIIPSSAMKADKKFVDIVSKVAEKYGVSENLIHAVIRAESSYNPDAVSPKGAGGLMQLMPATAEQYGVSDRFSPEENIDGGTKYLKFLLDRYEGDVALAVAAYNAGEGAVDKYGAIPPYAETRAYVDRISMFLNRN